jgi:hypothetical protein
VPRISAFLARYTRGRGFGRASHPPVRPRGFLHRSLRRYWIAVALPAAVLLGASTYAWSPWNYQPCAAGMEAVGSPYFCVGLDLMSAPLRENDPLAPLERIIARYDAQIKGPKVKTLVLLADLTPNPNTDSVSMAAVKHSIEGAITAVWRNNKPGDIKLLLANFGSGAKSWQNAVNAIISYRTSLHILAVTGLGESLDYTRQAVAVLSDSNIVTIGSVVTADNMNQWPDHKVSRDFFRVGPTNSDEVSAAVPYIKSKYHRIMMIEELNSTDSYARTLADDFRRKFGIAPGFASYYSPGGELTGTTRAESLLGTFEQRLLAICAYLPDLIYFAGRGRDISGLVTSLADIGCPEKKSVTIMTGDDVSDLIGLSLPLLSGRTQVTILYTAIAERNEWNGFPANSQHRKDYNDFVNQFTIKQGFDPADLSGGDAMMDYDAMAVAVKAATEIGDATDAISMLNHVSGITCADAYPGASGPIAFRQDQNQFDKAIPILQFSPDGSVHQVALVWSRKNTPLDMIQGCSLARPGG